MRCPLCYSEIKQNLISPSVALLACTRDSCVFPLNLSKEELVAQGLLVRTSDEEILTSMKEKFEDAGIEDRISQFLVKPGREA